MANAPTILPNTQTDPLAELRDIHLPGPIEFWPPAPGWWILTIVSVVLVVYATYRLWRWWQSNKYRRDALSSLNQLMQKFESDGDSISYLADLQILLKRVALSHYDRTQVASLSGEAWVAFLDTTGKTTEFSMGEGQALIDGHYIEHPEPDVLALHRLGQTWIRRHTGIPTSQLEVAA